MKPNQSAEKLTFRIFGMDCAEEVSLLRREVGPLVGSEDRLAFDVLAGKMTVTDVQGVDPRQVIQAVERAGLRAEPWSDDRSQNGQARKQFARLRLVLTIVSGVGALLGLLVHAVAAGDLRAAFGNEGLGAESGPPWFAQVLYAASVLAGVWMVLPKAARAVRRLRPDINLLMTIAVIGAVAIGEWFEAATVSFLFALSALLESWSIGRARKAIAALMDLAPPIVHVKAADGQVNAVSPDELAVGSIFVVRPGERIALDGTVTSGLSAVNQAPITGESRLIDKIAGDIVYAGTINGDGALEIKSSALVNDTTLARIIRMVEEAQTRRAPAEQWVESFSRIYTPAVMLLALAVLFVPPLLLNRPWMQSFYDSLVLLVIACPCALVISTPVSIVAGLAAAARNGVLIKGGLFLEIPARLRAIAFDKTGTLTRGKPEVVEVIPLNGHTESDLLERAAALEAQSAHPLAHAIVAFARSKGTTPLVAENLQTLQGRGITAIIDGRTFWLGSHRYLEERGQETAEVHTQLVNMTASGRTVVVIGNEQHVCGFIGLADQVRPEARDALQRLRDLGIQHIAMLTGDNRPTAVAVATQLGVDEAHSELLPQDKVKAIEALVAKYGQVAMLGDGINDAPALAQATIGIAMGAMGSDAALETADIALMSDDLSQLPWLVQHSRRTQAVIRQNIVLSLGIKAAFVMLTLVGWSTLWGAIAADMGTSLLVTANGLRLLRASPRN